MATPNILIPALGVMKFTILVDPSLDIITIYLVCLIYAWKYRRRFLRNTPILHFLHKSLLPFGVIIANHGFEYASFLSNQWFNDATFACLH